MLRDYFLERRTRFQYLLLAVEFSRDLRRQRDHRLTPRMPAAREPSQRQPRKAPCPRAAASSRAARLLARPARPRQPAARTGSTTCPARLVAPAPRLPEPATPALRHSSAPIAAHVLIASSPRCRRPSSDELRGLRASASRYYHGYYGLNGGRGPARPLSSGSGRNIE